MKTFKEDNKWVKVINAQDVEKYGKELTVKLARKRKKRKSGNNISTSR